MISSRAFGLVKFQYSTGHKVVSMFNPSIDTIQDYKKVLDLIPELQHSIVFQI